VETNRHPLVIGDHRQAVFPAQSPHALHLVRLSAEVDFAVNNPPPVKVRTQSRTVRTTIGRKNNDRVESNHLTHPLIAN